ncbi:MAG TPA: hypothetical protein EYQ60_04660 [Myxococcales bacterium]|nr:hypothetical protein [Myxococcales bacterium]HIK84009.1 hypothetical protein [Myxococcales bacterium]
MGQTAPESRLAKSRPDVSEFAFQAAYSPPVVIDLEAPDHTTLARRSRCLDVKLDLVVSSNPIHLIVDSTGTSIIA